MHSFEDFRAIVTVDEPLAPLTWFRLGGPAAFLARPRDLAEVAALLRRARERVCPSACSAAVRTSWSATTAFPGW